MTGRGGQSEDERLVGILLLLLAGPAVAMVVVPSARDAAEAWLVQRSVLVPASQALFAVPGMDSGPDLRRFVVGVLVLVALAAASKMLLGPRRERDGSPQ